MLLCFFCRLLTALQTDHVFPCLNLIFKVGNRKYLSTTPADNFCVVSASGQISRRIAQGTLQAHLRFICKNNAGLFFFHFS